MKKISIKPTDMSVESFRDYGQYLSEGLRAPDADVPELKFWNRLGELNHEGSTSVSIVQTYGKNGLFEETFERHLKTGEALLPIEDIYIVAALTDKNDPDKPDLDTVKAFAVKKGEAVILGPGVWHHAPLTEAETANTFVVFEADTPDKDFFAVELKEEFGVYFEVEK